MRKNELYEGTGTGTIRTCGQCQCRMTSTICPLNLDFEILT
jgi:hypothetical protein